MLELESQLPPPPSEMPPPQPPPPPSSNPQLDHGQFHAQQDQHAAGAQAETTDIECQWALKARAWAIAKEASDKSGSDVSSVGGTFSSTVNEDFLQLQQASTASFTPVPTSLWPLMPSTVSAGPQIYSRPQESPAVSAVKFGFGGSVPGLPIIEAKKRAVPSWLREELRKKAVTSTFGLSTDTIRQDETEVFPSSSPNNSESDKGEEQDELDSIRAAAINRQIKTILNEVLLKVTDGLFNQIAEEVLNEEKSKSQEPQEDATMHASEARVVLAALDGEDSSCAGNPLGLASYESDDDGTEAGRNDLEIHARGGRGESPKVYGPIKPEDFKRRCEEQAVLQTPPGEAGNVLKYDSDTDDYKKKRNKQHNKENVRVHRKDTGRDEHRRRRRDHSRRKYRHSKSPSPRRSSRSQSPVSPRKRKSHRRSRSPSPDRRRRERSRTRSPNRRYRRSRSRSPAAHRRRR